MPTRKNSSIPKSIHDEAQAEADKYKWLESEKQGYDLGPQAIEDWYQQFWAKYCRTRRLEHIAGEQHWKEFADHEFGQMYEKIVAGNEVLEELIKKIEAGKENLDLLIDMHNSNKTREEIEEILELLEIININIARLEPRLNA